MLTYTTKEATDFSAAFVDETFKCAPYHSESLKLWPTAFDDFNSDQPKIHVLVVCGKLLEGYDRKNVSIVAVVRNVLPTTRVLFSQFVARAVRRFDKEDPVTAVVLSHVSYNQKPNMDKLDDIADEDPDDS